ncbi:MAG: cupin [Candidatus Eisenbacteria bacterium]|uniref:Cupin n=1 Tax=Eiseniibacteriota bacterium TaxID=2212470 RepID=A0A948RX56_UNCEI|nr:cupin [Candidatus Eisenbacteria bacterium]MBU1951104.1 cupin [Candidatus Eisenbacteria bacterium]MBU2692490.1 cupin [Candidatus Eisenbacteria bacterium]
MPKIIEKPTLIEAAGVIPKRIEEYIGRVNSGHGRVSIARMTSPAGWDEPFQTPDFEEITLVLNGTLRVEYPGGLLDVCANQAIIVSPGERVRYSTPGKEGAQYISVCLPAFSLETVHREVV